MLLGGVAVSLCTSCYATTLYSRTGRRLDCLLFGATSSQWCS